MLECSTNRDSLLYRIHICSIQYLKFLPLQEVKTNWFGSGYVVYRGPSSHTEPSCPFELEHGNVKRLMGCKCDYEKAFCVTGN